MYSRRDFGKIALAGVPLLKVSGGVAIGVQTYSYRALPPGAGNIIDDLKADDAGEIELYSPGLVDRDTENLAQVRKAFGDAGVTIHSYTVNYRPYVTDVEIDKSFEQAKALGTNIIATSTQVNMAKRLLTFAEKHQMLLAFHGHSNTKDANEFATPESFQMALELSKFSRINLDIGHFSAAGFDPVAFIRKHHDKITHLHVKDRKNNDGPNVPWGEGDTPIKPVLLLLKEKKYPIPAFVEYEYRGTGTPVDEVKKCLDYMRICLT
jgi:sugar phosphate isomerase/epimerase